MGQCMSSVAPSRSKMATRKEYDYDSSPLPKDERMIRLIQLLKRADDSVVYDVVPFQLANAPGYEAISYRWGSPELSKVVIYLGDAPDAERAMNFLPVSRNTRSLGSSLLKQ